MEAAGLFRAAGVVGVLAQCRTLWNAKNGTKNPENADTHNTDRLLGREGGETGEQRGEPRLALLTVYFSL